MRLSQHAMLVVARKYAQSVEPKINYNLVLQFAREKLLKLNFEMHDELLKALLGCADADSGFLKPSEVQRVCIAVSLPLNHDLLTALIEK